MNKLIHISVTHISNDINSDKDIVLITNKYTSSYYILRFPPTPYPLVEESCTFVVDTSEPLAMIRLMFYGHFCVQGRLNGPSALQR